MTNIEELELSELDTKSFEALGAAWFAENTKRNPLPTTQDVHDAHNRAFYEPCECFQECCDEDTCDKCHGSGLAAMKACATCKGMGQYFIPDSVANESAGGHIDKDGNWVKGTNQRSILHNECSDNEKKLSKEARLEIFVGYSKSFMADDVFEFFKGVIANLGAKLEMHPIYEWDQSMVVYMPNYPNKK
jgi:hypothetical protein